MTPVDVTINDVARAAGVSKGLVSLALNGKPGVALETRDRILAAAQELGWTPNPGARGLTTRRAYALGLVLRRAARTIEVDPFFAAFIAGVETVLSERGQVLVLTVVPDHEAEARAYERLAVDKRVDGFLLTDLLADDHRIGLVQEYGSQAVSLGEPVGGSPFPVISRDYDSGIDALVAHLVDLGHRRIAHVSGDERMLHGLRRRERFESAVRASGLEPVVVATDFSPEQGAEATQSLLDSVEPPTSCTTGSVGSGHHAAYTTRTAWKSSSRPLGARPTQCEVVTSRSSGASTRWPLSSQTSRWRAARGDSPGSRPPPGRVQRPGAAVRSDSSVSRTPRSLVTTPYAAVRW